MTISNPERLRAVEAAKYLGISRSTLAKWRMKAEGPPAHRCGPRIVYYLKHELGEWLDQCDRRSIAQSTPGRTR
jgi:predicted DNA-binding transcriptional regulator AlpA